MAPNPFRIHGVATDEFFTDRAGELRRILGTFREPGAKLLVYGPRRMGKTSALVQAIEKFEAQGGVAFLTDMSTATTLADIANRLLESAGKAIGRKWKDALTHLVRKFSLTLKLTPDPATGLITPSLDLGLRAAPLAEQRKSLEQCLDALEGLAKERKARLAIVLDEFQEIQRFGGDQAEWHLRGILQRHTHVSYVLAGSQAHVIDQMLGKGRAFYGLTDQLHFGPIDPKHLAAWIDDRMTRAGVRAQGVGAAVVAAAGPRTRDIIQLARQCYDDGAGKGKAAPAGVSLALDEVVAQQEALLESLWGKLSPLQQNVLRAVAANLDGLTTGVSIRRFALTSSGSATNAASALVDAGHLQKGESKSGYGFDSPFFQRWVETRALPDVDLR